MCTLRKRDEGSHLCGSVFEELSVLRSWGIIAEWSAGWAQTFSLCRILGGKGPVSGGTSLAVKPAGVGVSAETWFG